MRTILLLLLTPLFGVLNTQAPYTVAQEDFIYQGIVKDESGTPLIGASILVTGTTTGTVTDIDGKFKLVHTSKCATLTVTYTGFHQHEKTYCADQAIEVTLRAGEALDEVVVIGYGTERQSDNFLRFNRKRPKSRRGAPAAAAVPRILGSPEPRNEDSYATTSENNFIKTKKEATSTFSIDVDAAGYSNIRRFLNDSDLPPADAVRSEEMINYFRYDYPFPTDNHPFAVTTELADCPWNNQHQLLLIGLKGEPMSREVLPPANFVFLLDVSGSMNGPDRLGLLKQSLMMLTDNLREEDKVSIVVYAGAAGLVLPPTSGADKNTIKAALHQLQAGGSTAGAAGIQLAYQTAREQFVVGGNNRVILATDGDFNVGMASNEAMEDLITKERVHGIFLSVLGFGRGNLQDDKMELLADKGNGNYVYIDRLSEARKVLVSEFGGTLFTIAKDVKLQVNFDPAAVSEYRLIGYENRLLDKEDFADDTKDAGELGAGHTVTALYEIVPGKGQRQGQNLATLALRYKQLETSTSQLMEHPIEALVEQFGQASANLRWAAAVAEFSMLLSDSKHKQDANYEHCQLMAEQARGRDPFGYRKEMITLITKAAELNSSVAEK